ncbi:MAG: glycoside hydrolase family 19 protein [Alcaligenaceae bacterium]|nr:glycoside hydrolase family 19 protein [Alcaligenaceae bacterium SAGV5]MPS51271.1 glycoside hydrolase family 19 protein [Alcaligenaceae bacterium SAGV3]MPT57232.1 glycoside hydrolase family 19 protein [Alcaligenaceae bacterium]
MSLTVQQIARCTGATLIRAAAWLPHLRVAMALCDVSTPARQAAFLAQIGHESGGLVYTTEIWGPTAAQRRYEGRRDLGNVQPGDGSRFRGHGLIQVTGRANHAAARDRLRVRLVDVAVPDFEAQPELLAQPRWAALSAADFWASRDLNELADAGNFADITRRINGGLNGYGDRLAKWEAGKAALGETS